MKANNPNEIVVTHNTTVFTCPSCGGTFVGEVNPSQQNVHCICGYKYRVDTHGRPFATIPKK